MTKPIGELHTSQEPPCQMTWNNEKDLIDRKCGEEMAMCTAGSVKTGSDTIIFLFTVIYRHMKEFQYGKRRNTESIEDSNKKRSYRIANTSKMILKR
ncbi:hypothetical protein RUM44_008582 [Polyplax serrata]|uniref:Uncharacterized protein n=1 Tax=Polyplax serrata TaxID=468196 RepID=A0ABR1BAK9_POLSC